MTKNFKSTKIVQRTFYFLDFYEQTVDSNDFTLNFVFEHVKIHITIFLENVKKYLYYYPENIFFL